MRSLICAGCSRYFMPMRCTARHCRPACRQRAYLRRLRPEPRPTVTHCMYCGEPLFATRSAARRYCGPGCRMRAWRARQRLVDDSCQPAPRCPATRCMCCRKPLLPTRQRTRKYCGPGCRTRAWRARHGFPIRCLTATFCRPRRNQSRRLRRPLPPQPCIWCGQALPVIRRRNRRYCDARCRKRAWYTRFRLASTTPIHQMEDLLMLLQSAPVASFSTRSTTLVATVR